MFDNFASSHQPRRRSRAGVLVLGSVAAHGAVVAALLVSAMWQIEKLRPADTEVVVSARGGTPDLPPGDPPPAEKLERTVERPKPRRPDETVQPTVAEAPPEEPDDGGGGGSDQPGGTGTGGGGGASLVPCVVDCGGEPGPAELPPPRAPAREKPPIQLSPKVLDGQRISGDPQIPAPDSVRLAMVRAGTTQLIGTVQMCLDRGGRVRSLRVLRSTGYDAYDARLLAGMRSWTYRPYRLDTGEAVPVCTAITFVYRMR